MTMAGQRIRVRGIVQGVGFRPFVWRLANELKLSGWVRNDGDGVEIEAFGSAEQLRELGRRLASDMPPTARIDAISTRDIGAAGGGVAFRSPTDAPAPFAILDSATGAVLRTAIGPDVGVCPDCVAEMTTPGSRRYRYAFTNCTHCGPRYTITRALPYDRARTSLAPFPLCPECAAEYADPADRRFHAEATCCPACGPRLRLCDRRGAVIDGDPLVATLARLCAGEIVAIKGLGGFHLACDARNAAAVARLRERKQREEKPFAVMVADVAAAAAWAQIGPAEAALLAAPERPAVLLAKTAQADAALAGVAPGIAWLGVMLPYTPIHVLLFHEAAGRAATSDAQALVLVMTSANPGGEPLVIDNAEARARLADIADAILDHDRAIVARCDDSVVRATRSGVQFLRRGRGFTPRAVKLPRSGPSVLAFGGWYKNTVCVTRADEAYLSAHIGDLDTASGCAFLDETVDRLLDLLAVRPEVVAHDLHPDFYSTQAARAFADRHRLQCRAVQHHHAHIAAVCAEHGVATPVLGLALDGVGLGTDGGAWGGELLHLDGPRMARLGHLRPLRLAGGDRAAREPWRMAAAALHELGRTDAIGPRFAAQPGATTIAQMLARGVNAPPTSSAGRYFDAAAGLLGVRTTMAYEGQAAMQLEGLAAVFADRHGLPPPLPGGWCLAGDAPGAIGELDLRPLLAALAEEADPHYGAALFHTTFAAALAAWVKGAARQHGVTTVVAAGGCLLNQVLARALRQQMHDAGLLLLEARSAPPNDGGLALGQAWVAMNQEV